MTEILQLAVSAQHHPWVTIIYDGNQPHYHMNGTELRDGFCAVASDDEVLDFCAPDTPEEIKKNRQNLRQAIEQRQPTFLHGNRTIPVGVAIQAQRLAKQAHEQKLAHKHEAQNSLQFLQDQLGTTVSADQWKPAESQLAALESKPQHAWAREDFQEILNLLKSLNAKLADAPKQNVKFGDIGAGAQIHINNTGQLNNGIMYNMNVDSQLAMVKQVEKQWADLQNGCLSNNQLWSRKREKGGWAVPFTLEQSAELQRSWLQGYEGTIITSDGGTANLKDFTYYPKMAKHDCWHLIRDGKKVQANPTPSAPPQPQQPPPAFNPTCGASPPPLKNQTSSHLPSEQGAQYHSQQLPQYDSPLKHGFTSSDSSVVSTTQPDSQGSPVKPAPSAVPPSPAPTPSATERMDPGLAKSIVIGLVNLDGSEHDNLTAVRTFSVDDKHWHRLPLELQSLMKRFLEREFSSTEFIRRLKGEPANLSQARRNQPPQYNQGQHPWLESNEVWDAVNRLPTTQPTTPPSSGNTSAASTIESVGPATPLSKPDWPARVKSILQRNVPEHEKTSELQQLLTDNLVPETINLLLTFNQLNSGGFDLRQLEIDLESNFEKNKQPRTTTTTSFTTSTAVGSPPVANPSLNQHVQHPLQSQAQQNVYVMPAQQAAVKEQHQEAKDSQPQGKRKRMAAVGRNAYQRLKGRK
eukprot:TRINITY_DN66350_c0_g1_i1.p1 TRINITY_DN66350_c0_g1~~TRINITY_DN66350_c0_g1_i1.p1  ORF type:complete len:733 (+),score=101.52 TRINITY_DN66350_c0_g1_i1:128-2200(+)